MNRLLHHWLFREVDASSLAVFRIMFGALLLFESVNYGFFLCLDCMYRDTTLLFKYQHFEWVTLWPGHGLEIQFVVMCITSLCIMLGLFYRVAMIVFTLAFSYLFLLDQALYLNHFYLVILFATIMIFVPAHRYWSLDARRRPEIAASRVPNWGRFWLAAQLEIVLIYAGFVKLNSDWLNLEPMRLWMGWRSQDAGLLFQWLTQDWGIALASYGIIALHLIGAPLLLWRRTRLAVLALYAVFHLTNAFVFNIGIFPFLTLGATLLLFDPDWPRQFARWLCRFTPKGRAVLQRLATPPPAASSSASPSASSELRTTTARYAVIALISSWLVVQIAVPLRHYAAPGDVAWNEDGHRFSWRMKLRSKQGITRFAVVREDGMRWVVNPADYLTPKQARKMACIPDLIWQFAQFLDARYSEGGRYEVSVHANAMCSLNTRERAPLIKREVDLSAIARDEPVTNWTWPLSKPLPDPLFSRSDIDSDAAAN